MKLRTLFFCSPNISEENDEKYKKRRAYFLQFITILSGYIMMLDVGAHSAWTAPALPHLISEESEFPVSITATSWLASVINISGIIGNMFAPLFMNQIGRRYTLLLFCIIQLVSWILINFSYNYTSLMIARIVVGLGTGGTFSTLPVYIGEITEKDIRGTFLSLDKIFMNSGAFLINGLGAFLPYKIMNLIMISVPITAMCLFPFSSETPYYYLMKNRDDEAIKTLMKLSGVKKQEMVMNDIKRMKEAVIESRKSQNSTIREIFIDNGSRRSLIIVSIAEITYVFSGHIAIQAYAQEILSYSGSSLKPGYAAMIMTGVQIFAGLPFSRFSDRWGRRPIYLFSGLMTAFALGIVGLFFFLKFFLKTDVSNITWLPLISLIFYQFTCNTGLATIPYIYSGELFSVKVKGVAVMFYSIVGSIFSFSVKMMLPYVNFHAGVYTTFWIFTCACVIGPIIVVYITPETKGKNLEEVLELMSGKTKRKFPNNS